MALAAPALEIRNLHKRYGELEVLKGISLTARDGDVISILGSSGSGKSTFLRCINLLENPHQGQILVAGEELKLKAAKNGELMAADGKQINRLRSEIANRMRNYKKVFLAAAVTLAFSAGAMAETLKMGIEAAYPPFNNKDASGNVVGFDKEIGDALCAKMKV
eukprot:gene14776-14572_t